LRERVKEIEGKSKEGETLAEAVRRVREEGEIRPPQFVMCREEGMPR